MNQDHISQQIQQYLNGALSGADQSDFERRLADDPALMQEVELQRLEKQVENELVARSFRDQMQRMDEQYPPTLPRRFSGSVQWLFWAGLIAAVGFGIWWFRSSNEPGQKESESLPQTMDTLAQLPDSTSSGSGSPQKLPPALPEKKPNTSPAETPPPYRQIALAYFFESVNQLTESARGNDNVEESGNSLQDADQYYQKGELLKAIAIMQNLADENPDASRLHLILGKLYFEAGNFPQAIAILQPIGERNSLHSSEARWNLLLSYLATYDSHQKDYEALLAKIIADPGHFGREWAIALQEKLKR